MACDIVLVWTFHFGDLIWIGKMSMGGKGLMEKHTISRKSPPTRSSPIPPSMRDPRASSSNSPNSSENLASSSMLLNIIRTSSGVIGAPVETKEDSDETERVREEDEDDECDDDGEKECGCWPEIGN